MSVPPPTQLSVSSSDSNSVTLTWFNAENYDKVLIAYVLGDNPSSPITQQFDFNDPNPSVVDLSSYTVTGIDSTSGHAFVFKVKGGKRSDIFGAGITWDYSDWTTFVWNNPYVGSFVDSGTERTTNIFALSNFRAVENAHTFPGHFSWYEHLGAGSGSFTWGVQNAPITLTTAPSFRQLFTAATELSMASRMITSCIGLDYIDIMETCKSRSRLNQGDLSVRAGVISNMLYRAATVLSMR